MKALPIKLIVNADDYGYYPCVSRGILQAAAVGSVTATGILANGPQLQEQLAWLSNYEKLDLGIHLNLTSRQPLTANMQDKLMPWQGQFPSVFTMTRAVLSGQISVKDVREEWQTQIETVLGFGIKPQFLNSHEHIHMLPPLFNLAKALAKDYQIPHLRLTRAEWMPPYSSLLRTGLLQIMESVDALRVNVVTPYFIGLSRSGKLDLDYLSRRFARLKPGKTYELMCHPGYFDPTEITDSRLLAYHSWEAELATLTSPAFQQLCAESSIRLVNYREQETR